MEQAGASTATKSLSGLCKEVRAADRIYMVYCNESERLSTSVIKVLFPFTLC